jgi:SAM-dependent methyltransferase
MAPGMSLGASIRRVCGPFERPLAEAYRRIYVDLDALVAWIVRMTPAPRRILEVGCGEGAMTERLARAYRESTILAIDVSPAVGRLYRGNTTRVELRRTRIDAVVSEAPRGFDLVLLCDVLHHVPLAERTSLLADIRRATAPDGALVFKEWTRSNTPIHYMCEFSDRYLTGDEVSYYTCAGLRQLALGTFGKNSVVAEMAIKPWKNNLALLVKPK